MKKIVVLCGVIATIGLSSTFGRGQYRQDIGDVMNVNTNYSILAENCSYNSVADKYTDCTGTLGNLERQLVPKIENISRRIVSESTNIDTLITTIESLDSKLVQLKNRTVSTRTKFLIELIQQEFALSLSRLDTGCMGLSETTDAILWDLFSCNVSDTDNVDTDNNNNNNQSNMYLNIDTSGSAGVQFPVQAPHPMQVYGSFNVNSNTNVSVDSMTFVNRGSLNINDGRTLTLKEAGSNVSSSCIVRNNSCTFDLYTTITTNRTQLFSITGKIKEEDTGKTIKMYLTEIENVEEINSGNGGTYTYNRLLAYTNLVINNGTSDGDTSGDTDTNEFVVEINKNLPTQMNADLTQMNTNNIYLGEFTLTSESNFLLESLNLKNTGTADSKYLGNLTLKKSTGETVGTCSPSASSFMDKTCSFDIAKTYDEGTHTFRLYGNTKQMYGPTNSYTFPQTIAFEVSEINAEEVSTANTYTNSDSISLIRNDVMILGGTPIKAENNVQSRTVEIQEGLKIVDLGNIELSSRIPNESIRPDRIKYELFIDGSKYTSFDSVGTLTTIYKGFSHTDIVRGTNNDFDYYGGEIAANPENMNISLNLFGAVEDLRGKIIQMKITIEGERPMNGQAVTSEEVYTDIITLQ